MHVQPGQRFLQSLLSVKQLEFKTYIILCRYIYHSFLQGSKTKNRFGEINISDCNFLSSSYRGELKKVEV